MWKNCQATLKTKLRAIKNEKACKRIYGWSEKRDYIGS